MPEFNGFQPQDFDDLEGSTWRGRETLGGVTVPRALAPVYEMTIVR